MMKKVTSLQEYLDSAGLNALATFSDGATRNPAYFPMQGIEVEGAVLFADLPEYSLKSKELTPAECAFLTNHYFAWMEGAAIRNFGGFIDKFIGDELMVVFIKKSSDENPLKAALHTAKFMLDNDSFAFEPKIGIATGPFIIARVGTKSVNFVSAIGHTVNLAAQCVQEQNSDGRAIRVATNNLEFIKDIFSENYWTIEGPNKVNFKNISESEVIDIKCKAHYLPQFKYIEWVKKGVEDAYKNGTIKKSYSE